MSILDPNSPSRADYRFIRKVISTTFEGQMEHMVEDYDKIIGIFRKAGGSWERVFKGSVEDIVLLKKIIKTGIKHKKWTQKQKWK